MEFVIKIFDWILLILCFILMKVFFGKVGELGVDWMIDWMGCFVVDIVSWLVVWCVFDKGNKVINVCLV